MNNALMLQGVPIKVQWLLRLVNGEWWVGGGGGGEETGWVTLELRGRSQVWGLRCGVWDAWPVPTPLVPQVRPLNSPVFLMGEITHRQLVACISHTATNSWCQEQQSRVSLCLDPWESVTKVGVAVSATWGGGGRRGPGSQAGGSDGFVLLPTWDFPH